MPTVSGTTDDLELRRQRLFERLRAEVEGPATPEQEPRDPDPPVAEIAVHEPEMVDNQPESTAELVEPEFGAAVAEDPPLPDTDGQPEGVDEPEPDLEPAASEARQEPESHPEPAPEAVEPRETAEPLPVQSDGEIAAAIPALEPAVVEAAAAEEPEKPPRPDLPRILAVANQKGGVGKTTTTVNLGAGLAEIGYRVLVIDLDPQGNATTGLGINGRNLEVSIYDVLLHDTPMEDCVEPTSLKNLFVVPATIDLAGAEIELVPAFSRELRLRKALDEIIEDFDYVLIDCPPSLGLLTVNGLAAATEVLVPIQCEYYALEGLSQLLRNVDLVHQNLNPQLHLSTIVMTMFDARTKLADQVVGEVRSHFGAKVCRNIIPRTVRLSEAPSFGQPITMFDPTSRGAIAYRELAKEVSGGAPQRAG